MVTSFTQDLHRIEIVSVKLNIIKNPVYINVSKIEAAGDNVTLYLGDVDITLSINYGYDVKLCKRVLQEIFENIPNFVVTGGDNIDNVISKFAEAIQYRRLYKIV